MYKFIILFVLFFFTGCLSTPSAVEKQDKKAQTNKKVFEEEDALILFALRAEQVKDYTSASNLFESLYNKSNRKEYLHRSLQNNLFLKKNKYVINKVDEVSQGSLDDFILVRLKVIGLIQNNELEKALSLGIALVEKSQDEDDYILVSDIYIVQEEFDKAVKYLEGAYIQEYSEKILDKMSILLYVNLERKKDAIAYLETHTRVHGCSQMICKRLISLYSNENNVDGLLSTYLRFYKINSHPDVATKIVQLYQYKKEYIKLILFLEESGGNDKVLLDIYIGSKNYKKAFPLSRKLYDETGESKYLGESVIFEYESQNIKDDKVFLTKIAKKFEEVIQEEPSALYLNYYGYILIDHDVDVTKGMKYVRQALTLEGDSPFYLDSLAWGYYKLGECAKALKVIEKVRTLDGGDDKEVLYHHEKIKKCKGKNK